MRLCILETDTYDDLPLEEHGTLSGMFQSWLGPVLHEASWTSIAVYSGEDFPEPENFHGYLITGSRYGVYDDLPWMAPLKDFICRLKALEIPVAGVCFGHQIMAAAYGARVEKSQNGWVLGAETYGDRTAFAMHQDQVRDIPPGGTNTASTQRCEIARLDYDFPAFSVQYHPEFSPDFMEGLLDLYGDGEIDPDLIASARTSLDDQTDVKRIAEDFATFFRKNRHEDSPVTH